jgi:putative acetyltransferase
MTCPFEIRAADLCAPEVVRLLQEHLEFVAIHSPPESVHALDLDALRAPEISFWTAWEGSVLAGCGALKELSTTHGELKSMRTASSHLRRGVAAGLVEHLLGFARERGYRRVSLETGSMEAFAPAHALYASFGFEPCGPFANYIDDPYSTFMTRKLDT